MRERAFNVSPRLLVFWWVNCEKNLEPVQRSLPTVHGSDTLAEGVDLFGVLWRFCTMMGIEALYLNRSWN